MRALKGVGEYTAAAICSFAYGMPYAVVDGNVSVSYTHLARLKQLLQSIKPKNFGVIVRTVAEGNRVAELDAELKVCLLYTS